MQINQNPRFVVRHLRFAVVAVAVALVVALLCASDLAPKAFAADKPPKCDEKDVVVTQRLINNEPFYCLVPNPNGKEGVGIMMSNVVRGDKGKPTFMDQETFNAQLAAAQAYRDAKLDMRKRAGWSKRVWWARSAHFDGGMDLDQIEAKQYLGPKKSGSIPAVDGLLEYMERAERIFNDMAAVMGPMDNSDIRGPVQWILHDLRADAVLSCMKINKKETHPGPTRSMFGLTIMWWDRAGMPTDFDLWENFTHNIAGVLAIQYRGVGKFQGNIPAWIDEGLAFYYTRIHRELDVHTTIMFTEQLLETAAHIDGSTWKAHAKKVASGLKDDAVKKILEQSMAKLTQDDRILCWSIIVYLTDYSIEKTRRTLMALNTDKKTPKAVDLAEWMADPLRWDVDGDGTLSDDEKAKAESEFNKWDCNKDGSISLENEVYAHAFREFLVLQKGGPNALSDIDALQRAYGWTLQDLMERWRAWLDDRPIVEKADKDLSLIADWRKFQPALRAMLKENEKDEQKAARYLLSLLRWQTREAVIELYSILEDYEKALEAGKIPDRALKINEAAQRIVANYSNADTVGAVFDIILTGKCQGKTCAHLAVRNTLLRGLGKNQGGSGVNSRLGEACGHAEFGIKVAALDTLKERGIPLGADQALEAVKAALKDTNRPVKIAAAQCLAKITNRSEPQKFCGVLEALADAMFNEQSAALEDLYKALKELSGDDVGPDYNRWKMWVTAYKAALAKGEAAPKPKVEKKRDATSIPTHMGDEILAKQIVFVVDRSYSMIERLENKQAVITGMERKKKERAVVTGEGSEKGQPAANPPKNPGDDLDWSKIHTKWDLAREATCAAIKGLTPEHSFTVVLFDHRVFVWQPRLVKATPDNVKSAIDFICTQPNPDDADKKWGLTNIYDAIAKGMEFTTGEKAQASGVKGGIITGSSENNLDLATKGADEIRFLTDGDPTDGKYVNRQELLAHIRELNRTRKIRINVFAIGIHDKGFMRALAEQNNGKYEDWTYDSGLK